jgi:RNA polymerase sigma-70 factor
MSESTKDLHARVLHAFRAALTDEQRARLPEQTDALRSTLVGLLAEARAEWPALKVTSECFAAYLGARIAPDADPLDGLRTLHATDLYLCCGCSDGDATAREVFSRTRYSQIIGPLKRLALPPAVQEEVTQTVLADLFDTTPDAKLGAARPMIAKYSGRGSLAGWLRVIVVRYGMKRLRAGRRFEHKGDEALEAIPSLDEDAELAHMKRLYRGAFKQAFLYAMRQLSDRQITLLRQHYVDGVTTHQLGALHRVHQTSAARWLREARELLRQRTRERLIEQLSLRESDYPSIVRLVQSQLALTLVDFFESSDDDST